MREGPEAGRLHRGSRCRAAFRGRIMVAGFLVLGIAAGLVAGGAALVAGHALWVAGLAYMLGGMLGMGLGIALALIGPRRDVALHGDA
jgi:high-affinity Fe2+/Pb2+ permease